MMALAEPDEAIFPAGDSVSGSRERRCIVTGEVLPEARLLLRDLTEHATQREFVYVHKWTLHDLVMWDNRQTMHRVRRYDQSQPRDMRRATVAGTEPTVQQQAAE